MAWSAKIECLKLKLGLDVSGVFPTTSTSMLICTCNRMLAKWHSCRLGMVVGDEMDRANQKSKGYLSKSLKTAGKRNKNECNHSQIWYEVYAVDFSMLVCSNIEYG